jgi:DNA polymerase-3 subunit epsilon
LSEEFSRCGILFPEPNTKSVDVGVLFKKLEQRTLAAAMKFYNNVDDFEEIAHDASEDTKATIQVFYAMLLKYDELKGKDIAFLSDFCKLKEGQLDFQGKLFRNEKGVICFNFGNDAVKGKPVIDSKSFANWVLSKEDMPMTTKLWIRKALEEEGKGVIPNLFDNLPKKS